MFWCRTGLITGISKNWLLNLAGCRYNSYRQINLAQSHARQGGVMGWEQRGPHRYYYVSSWVDGRVVKKYVGRGAKASRAEAEMLEREEQRLHMNAVIGRWSREMDEIDTPIRQMFELADQIMEADLLSSNFYQAGRVWRKRRRILK